MTCACPKCETAIRIEPDHISYTGTQLNCPKCKGKFWTQREDYSRRAYKKPGKIYCFGCGGELGNEVICLSCGKLYPEYSVVQTSKPVQRKQRKEKTGFSFNLDFKPAKKRAEKTESVLEPVRETDTEVRTNFKPLAFAAMAVMVVVLIVGIAKFYSHAQARQQYSKDFIVALFGIKSGADFCLKNSREVSTTWESTGQAVAPRISQKKLDHLNDVKQQIDLAMDKLAETPEEFSASRDKLARLYQVYLKTKALNESPPASFTVLADDIQKLENDFTATARSLRDVMPEALHAELKESVARYRNLKFLLEKA